MFQGPTLGCGCTLIFCREKAFQSNRLFGGDFEGFSEAITMSELNLATFQWLVCVGWKERELREKREVVLPGEKTERKKDICRKGNLRGGEANQ